MKKALTLTAVLMGLTLTLASRPAKAADAYDALQQLGLQAGVDAAPIANRMKTIRALSAAEVPQTQTIARDSKDIFEDCSALEARSFAPWTPKQAALLVQTCLNHAYAADGRFSVRAEAARFGVRACPENVPGTMSCQAIVEVVGIKITVSGSLLTGNSVLNDLNGSLKKRGGKLMGFSAIVDNQAKLEL
jgi:hypothetical protein